MANLISQITPLGSSTTFDIKASAFHYVNDSTGTAAVTSNPYTYAKWNATIAKVTSLYDGLTIVYKVPVAGNGSYGTCLQVNSLGYHPVVTHTNSMIGTRYGTNAIILLVYNSNISGTVYNNSGSSSTISGCWVAINDYDSGNTNAYMYYQVYSEAITKTALYRYQMLLTYDETQIFPINTVNNSTATTKTLTTEEFDPFGPIYYWNSTSTLNANTQIGNWAGLYRAYHAIDLRYSFNTGSTLTANKAVFMVCTPQSNGKAKLHSSPISQTLPTTEDGKIYIYLGRSYSTYQITLDLYHPIYYYKNGAVRLWTNPEIYWKTTPTVSGEVLVSNGTDGGISTSGYTISQLISSSDAMVFKGVVGTGTGMISLPTTPREAGWTYKVGTAGTYAGKTCEVGDMILCVKSVASGGTTSNDDFIVVQANVDKPLYADGNTITDNAFLVADGTAGKVKTVTLTQKTISTVSSWNAGAAASLTTSNYTITPMTSAGTAPSLTTATTSFQAVSYWNAGSVPSLGTAFTIKGINSVGSAPTLGTAFTIKGINSVGSAPTLGTAFTVKGMTNEGTWPTLGTAFTIKGVNSTGSAATLGDPFVIKGINSVGSAPTLGTAFTIKGINSVGSAPTLGTAFTVKGINSVGTAFTATVSDEMLILTAGSTPTTSTYTIPNVTSVGSVPTTSTYTVPNVTSVGSVPTVSTYTVPNVTSAGSAPTTITYTIPNVDNIGSAPTFSTYTIPNVTSVGSAPTTSTYTVPNVTSVGSAPTTSTYTVPNVTGVGSVPTLTLATTTITGVGAWSAGSAATAGTAVTIKGVNVFTANTLPSLTLSTATVLTGAGSYDSMSYASGVSF